MPDTLFELQVSGIAPVSGTFFFTSGTQLASGVGGDVSPYINYFQGQTGYSIITLNQNTNFTGIEDIFVPLFSGTDLGFFASGIYNDLMPIANSPFGISYISGWLMNHIGELNTNLQTNFNTVSGFALPPLNFQEVAIYQELFTQYYYNRSASNLLGASQYDWVSLAEADSKIVKISRNELAKTYRQLALDSREKTIYLIAQYRMTAGQPLSVIGDDINFNPFGFGNGCTNGFDSIFPYFNWFFVRSSTF
jgi:hypothetical protein